jgi:2-keto-4-pentenoate hydratase/2-oxohepta-3-ene-1,7-dioic acid hydratase in catechol pathway
MTRSGLATVMLGGHLTLAVWVGGRLRALAEAASELGLAADSVPSTMRAALADWDRWCDVAAEAAAGAASREGWVDEETVEFCPAITDPPNVYCAGANYHDHVQEMGGKAPAAGGRPFHFVAATSALNGHGQPVTRPADCGQLDWEVELAVLIGQPAYRVDADQALAVVAGYTVANDLSLRDFARRTDVPFYPDWLLSKCYAGCLPLGPAIVPARDIPDPMNLGLTLSVNGETRQASNTKEMIFSIAQQIEYLSHVLPLRPGDVILTGTPAGTAARGGTYLEPGDIVVADVEMVGSLRNHVVAPAGA